MNNCSDTLRNSSCWCTINCCSSSCFRCSSSWIWFCAGVITISCWCNIYKYADTYVRYAVFSAAFQRQTDFIKIYWLRFNFEQPNNRCFTSCVGNVDIIGAAGVTKPVLTTGCKLTVVYCACSIKLMQLWSTSNKDCCCDCCCCCCCCCCCLLSIWGIWVFDGTELFAEAPFDRETCVICECGELCIDADIDELSELSTWCRGRLFDAIDFDVFDDFAGHCVGGTGRDAVTCRKIAHTLFYRMSGIVRSWNLIATTLRSGTYKIYTSKFTCCSTGIRTSWLCSLLKLSDSLRNSLITSM